MQHRTVSGFDISCFIVCWLGLFGMLAWSFGLVDAWTATKVWFGEAVLILIISLPLRKIKAQVPAPVVWFAQGAAAEQPYNASE